MRCNECGERENTMAIGWCCEECKEKVRSRQRQMSPNEYQEAALRTASTESKNDLLENAAMGLNGEAGELIDHIKKWRFQGHDLDYDYIAKELGDVAWYIAIGAEAIDMQLNDILVINVEKLKKRYPDGFEAERSRNRV